MKTNAIRTRTGVGAKIAKVTTYVVLTLWALTTILPFLWVIVNSFKPTKFIRSQSFALPVGKMFTLENYITGAQRVNIFRAYTNSLVISGTVTILVILLAGLVAYGMVRYNFRGKKLLHTIIVAAMMFPVFSTIIPVFRMQFAWGIVENASIKNEAMQLVLHWLSVILPQTAGNLAFATIILMGFIRSMPIDLEEAAFLEGYNVFGIFFKIIVPLARPSFATVAIFSFLWSYNDLFTQMFFLRSKEYHTITRMLNEISSQAGTNYGLMCAAVVLVVVPILIVYVLLQKNIVKGLTAGALKG